MVTFKANGCNGLLVPFAPEITLSLISEVLPPTGIAAGLYGASPTHRQMSGRCLLSTGGLVKGFPVHLSDWENLKINFPQFSQQVDDIDRSVAVAMLMQLF